MENTYAEYKQWLASENLEEEKSIKDGYNKALSRLQQIQIFEDRLVSIFFISFLISNMFICQIMFKLFLLISLKKLY